MVRRIHLHLAVIATGLLASCAQAPHFAPVDDAAFTAERKNMVRVALASWDAEQARLNGIRLRLWQTAVARGQCKATQPGRGAVLETVADLPDGLRAETQDTGYRTAGLYVAAVAPGSPAAVAGLQAGEHIVAAGGDHAPAQTALPPEWNSAEDISLDVVGPGGSRTVHIGSVPLCAVDVVLEESHDLVAYYDGGRIHVSQGMVQALPDDPSLAFVIAHELGHATAKHTLMAHFFDPAGSRDQEREADLLGVRLVAYAGYDLGHLADIWDRLAQLDPNRISPTWLSDHPLRAERKLRMQAAIAALASERAQ